jgi:hypothetical protein
MNDGDPTTKRRRYFDDDPFFDEGNEQRENYSKCNIVSFEQHDCNDEKHNENINITTTTSNNFFCNIESCKCSFRTSAEYASHYAVQHRHKCETCSAVLPNQWLLDLHIAERHDSYFATVAERKPSYKCIVQSCANTFWKKQERDTHLQTVHLFPKHFCYDMQKRRKGKSKSKNIKKLSDDDSAELVQLMSKTTISFGRSKKKKHDRVNQHWSNNFSGRKKKSLISSGVGTTFGDLSNRGAGSTASAVPKLNRRQRRALARATAIAEE